MALSGNKIVRAFLLLLCAVMVDLAEAAFVKVPCGPAYEVVIGRAHGRKKSEIPPLEPLEQYLREVDAIPVLTRDEDLSLPKRIAQGDVAALHRMILGSLRQVVQIARRYENKGLPLQDLIQEGNLALFMAVEGYDPLVGTQFPDYAERWIKQAMKRAIINQRRTVRVPVWAVDTMKAWDAKAVLIEKETGDTPTPDQIAGALGLGKKAQACMLKALSNRQEGETDDYNPLEGVRAQRERNPAEEAELRDLLAKLSNALAYLRTYDPDLYAVVLARYPLDGSDAQTLRELGTQLGTSRTTVMTRERRALEILAELIGLSE